MSIEWLPRRDPDGNGWRKPGVSLSAGAPRLGSVPPGPLGGDLPRTGILVPKAPSPPTRFSLRRLAVGRIGFPGVMGLWWGAQALAHSSWGPEVLAVGVGGVVLWSSGVAVAGSRRTGSLALTPTHLHSGVLAVPWGSIEKVVRFSLGTGPLGDPRRLSYLAVRVGDFDNVQGLAPARAGLANLTRRHLLVLAESHELQAPMAVAAALDYLVERPEARLLLSGVEGVRLLSEGPPRSQ
ncbi:MAG: hypothetical protein ABI243_12900 [Lapillicoccus sp.]